MNTAHAHHGTTTPTQVLREEHQVILRALTLLERVGQQLAAGQPIDRDRLSWLRDFFKTFADRCHHGKEEQLLFPTLERRGVPRAGGPIGVMLEEHDQGRAFVRAIGQGSDAEIAAAIRGYTRLLRAHIDKEDGVLFPLADHVLDEREMKDLAREFEAVETTVAPPGFHDEVLARLAEMER